MAPSDVITSGLHEVVGIALHALLTSTITLAASTGL